MCTGAEVQLIVVAVGAATSAVNQNQAIRRKDRELARGLIEQGKLDKEAAARLDRELNDLEASSPAEDTKIAQDAFRSALRENQDLQTSAAQGVPGASERFAENVAAGKAAITGKADVRGQLLGKINAPVRQREKEGQKFGRLATDFGDIARRSQSENFIAQLRAGQQVPNPFVEAGAQFAQSFGSANPSGSTTNPGDFTLTEPPFDPLDPGRI